MCRLWFEGKVKEAAKMQLDMMDLVEKLFIDVNPIPVKNAMNMMGMDVGELKLPLVDLSEENTVKVRQALINYGLIK
ncbi:MAG: dihydrodipicolinate synthase family protein [Clostridia bacterium]|nr:dihydrodipicolinate synthase family protein [Clostridia bacterium]